MHCFHGELLDSSDQYSAIEIRNLLDHFRANYRLESVTFLGGEPMMHPDIVELVAYGASVGLSVEMCTNGHASFQAKLKQLAPWLTKIRISLDGLEATHDRIRHPGSFSSAIGTISTARELGLPVGVTFTVNALNFREVIPLARMLDRKGVTELKLHHLRTVGNAAGHPELYANTGVAFGGLRRDIESSNLSLDVIYDADLFESQRSIFSSKPDEQKLDRIEIDPQGNLTVSCKAVGLDASAFFWDKNARSVRYSPSTTDEFQLGIPDVLYLSSKA
jgi:molybdenum cofactor biosynthesis enzyme MoaA